MPFQTLFWQKLAFSSTFFYLNYLYSILSPGALVMLLFSLLISVCQDHVQFLPFTVEVLSKLYQSYSFSILFIQSVVPSAQVLVMLSSFISLFNQSAARIGSSLFLFSNGGFSTLLIFVVFFLSICSTSQGSLVSLVCQRSNLVLPLLFLFRFPSGAILDLGTRSSRSGGVL